MNNTNHLTDQNIVSDLEFFTKDPQTDQDTPDVWAWIVGHYLPFGFRTHPDPLWQITWERYHAWCKLWVDEARSEDYSWLEILSLEHNSYRNRHLRFEDEARGRVEGAVKTDFWDNVDDEAFGGGGNRLLKNSVRFYGVVSEVMIRFYIWAGGEIARVRDLKWIDIGESEKRGAVGVLHAIEDAETVEMVMKYIRNYSERIVDGRNIDAQLFLKAL